MPFCLHQETISDFLYQLKSLTNRQGNSFSFKMPANILSFNSIYNPCRCNRSSQHFLHHPYLFFSPSLKMWSQDRKKGMMTLHERNPIEQYVQKLFYQLRRVASFFFIQQHDIIIIDSIEQHIRALASKKYLQQQEYQRKLTFKSINDPTKSIRQSLDASSSNPYQNKSLTIFYYNKMRQKQPIQNDQTKQNDWKLQRLSNGSVENIQILNVKTDKNHEQQIKEIERRHQSQIMIDTNDKSMKQKSGYQKYNLNVNNDDGEALSRRLKLQDVEEEVSYYSHQSSNNKLSSSLSSSVQSNRRLVYLDRQSPEDIKKSKYEGNNQDGGHQYSKVKKGKGQEKGWLFFKQGTWKEDIVLANKINKKYREENKDEENVQKGKKEEIKIIFNEHFEEISHLQFQNKVEKPLSDIQNDGQKKDFTNSWDISGIIQLQQSDSYNKDTNIRQAIVPQTNSIDKNMITLSRRSLSKKPSFQKIDLGVPDLSNQQKNKQENVDHVSEDRRTQGLKGNKYLKHAKQERLIIGNREQNIIPVMDTENDDKNKIKLKASSKTKHHSYLRQVDLKPEPQAQKLETITMNKVVFNVEAKRKVQTETSEKQQQNKKFASILKKREQAIARKMRQQLQVRSKIVFNEQSQGQNSGKDIFKNQTYSLRMKEDKGSALNMTGFQDGKGNQQANNRTKKQIGEKDQFPTVKITTSKGNQGKIRNPVFYDFQSQDSSKLDSKIPSLMSRQKFKSDYSSSQKSLDDQIRLKRHENLLQPYQTKISYSKLNSYSKDQKRVLSNTKNTSAKEKYDRLKQLLEQF